jgi:hypothetical protein
MRNRKPNGGAAAPARGVGSFAWGWCAAAWLLAGCGGAVAGNPSSPPVLSGHAPGPPPTRHPTARPAPAPTVPGRFGVTQSAPASGDAVVRQALTAVAGTTRVPLWGPVGLPGRSGSWYLGASTQATKTTYTVYLQWADAPLAVGSPRLRQPPNTGLAQVLGAFGGRRYANPTAARLALPRLAGYWQPPPPGSPRLVFLTARVRAEVWSAAGGEGFVQWSQGGWQLQINGLGDVALAVRLAQYLARHPLPAARGLLAVEDAGDGEHTQLAWQRGAIDYFAGNYHQALAAVQMAEAMEPYPVASDARRGRARQGPAPARGGALVVASPPAVVERGFLLPDAAVHLVGGRKVNAQLPRHLFLKAFPAPFPHRLGTFHA